MVSKWCNFSGQNDIISAVVLGIVFVDDMFIYNSERHNSSPCFRVMVTVKVYQSHDEFEVITDGDKYTVAYTNVYERPFIMLSNKSGEIIKDQISRYVSSAIGD